MYVCVCVVFGMRHFLWDELSWAAWNYVAWSSIKQRYNQYLHMYLQLLLHTYVSGFCACLVPRRIPFQRIHQPPVPFDDRDRQCFMPGNEICVEIVAIDQSDHSKILNPNLWVSEFQLLMFFKD